MLYTGKTGKYEKEIHTYLNDLGQTVEQSAGLLRNDDGSVHKAYAAAPGTYVGLLIQKQKKGTPLTEAERKAVEEYWAKNPTAGLATIDQLGGNHRGGISGTSNDAGGITKNADGTYSIKGKPGWYTKTNFS